MVKPKLEYSKAYKAMRELGVPKETVAPVLKNLLKLYSYNWGFIEAEHYRVLVDAVFESQAPEVEEVEMEKEEEPPAKKLHVEAADGEALKREDLSSLRDEGVGASSNLCLGHGADESGGGEVREVPCVDAMEVNNKTTSKISVAGHSSSLKGASTKNGTRDLVGNRFDNGNSKISSRSSVLGEVKYKRSSESGVDSNFGTTRQSSVEAIDQDGLDCGLSSSEGCLMPKLSDVVFHEKEPGISTSPGAKSNKKEDSIPDKKPHPVANGKCKGKGKKSSAQDKGLVDDDGIWELSLQEYKNQGTVSDKKKLVFAADVAKGKEKVKIPIVGDDGNEDYLNFCYIATNLIYQDASVSVSLARISDEDCCVDCLGNCLYSPITCGCARETGGEFAYTIQGLLKEKFLEACMSMNQDPEDHHFVYCKNCPKERFDRKKVRRPCQGHLVKKFIKECWSKCGCGIQCGNRVVQRGIIRDLQVFWTPEGKGWGLRVAEDLPKGAFVCEYVGEILTNNELHERNEQRSGERHVYPVLLDADWASESILKDEEALCLDATFYGNVARFINHRCEDATLVEVPVQVETPDRHYYHVAFFTTREVKAFEELTWDYGIDFDDRNHPVKAFECSCGSELCRDKKRRGGSARPRKTAARRRR
ncbi:hypothetical protein Drorol1_Dr00026134 [Drosera rotundifolia]